MPFLAKIGIKVLLNKLISLFMYLSKICIKSDLFSLDTVNMLLQVCGYFASKCALARLIPSRV